MLSDDDLVALPLAKRAREKREENLRIIREWMEELKRERKAHKEARKAGKQEDREDGRTNEDGGVRS